MDIQATGGVPAALQQRTAVTSGTTTTAKPAAPAATDSKPTGKAASKEDAQAELKEVKQAVSDIKPRKPRDIKSGTRFALCASYEQLSSNIVIFELQRLADASIS